MADQVVASIDGAPGEELALRMAQLDALDRPGRQALIELLAHSNVAVADAAAETLLARIDHWRKVPPVDSTPRVETLAQDLADRAAKLSPRGDEHARRLALELLAWPTAGDAARLLSDCEKTLRIADARSSSQNDAVSKRPSQVVTNETASARPEQSPVAIALPGGGLPFEIAPVHSLPSDVAPLPRPVRVIDERPLVEEPPQHLRPPYALPLPPPASDQPPPPPATFEPQHGPVTPLQNDNQLEPASAFEARPAGFDGVDSFELMQFLHDEEPQFREQAEVELRDRGFTDRHLAMARMLTSPDVETRLEFVSLLPRLPNLDPRSWLMRLSRDQDDRVRQAALAVMATTRDPRLLDRARTGLQ